LHQLDNIKKLENNLMPSTPLKSKTFQNRNSMLKKFPTTISKSGDTIKIAKGDRNERSSSSSDSSYNFDIDKKPDVKINEVSNSSGAGNSFNIGLYMRAFSLNRKK
jgi:hypothetical protein